MANKKYTYHDLLEIIRLLRSEQGCPWDREQSHTSLIPCLLEESYELMEALQNADISHMREELGDVLLQVLMHTQIATEANEFTIDDVIDELATKLVYRHPHVFKEGESTDRVEEVLESWESLKQKEKKEKTLIEAMERVAKTLPALTRTQKIQKKALKAGMINIDGEQIIDELIYSLGELKTTLNSATNRQNEEEIGEMLLEVVKLSTFFDINAEITLTKSLEKFINRFRYIENSRLSKD